MRTLGQMTLTTSCQPAGCAITTSVQIRLKLLGRYIAEIPRKLRENYICKVGVVYGKVIEAEKPIEFYFEAQERKVEDNG